MVQKLTGDLEDFGVQRYIPGKFSGSQHRRDISAVFQRFSQQFCSDAYILPALMPVSPVGAEFFHVNDPVVAAARNSFHPCSPTAKIRRYYMFSGHTKDPYHIKYKVTIQAVYEKVMKGTKEYISMFRERS